MTKDISAEETQRAREEYRKKEKQQLIDSFEKHGAKTTDYSIVEHDDWREFFYGIPVMEDGKLQGFNMMKFNKFYDEEGRGHRGEALPYNDKDGKQVFMTVDEYYKFYKELEKNDGRLGALLAKYKEDTIVENTAKKDLREHLKKIKERVSKVFGKKGLITENTEAKSISLGKCTDDHGDQMDAYYFPDLATFYRLHGDDEETVKRSVESHRERWSEAKGIIVYTPSEKVKTQSEEERASGWLTITVGKSQAKIIEKLARSENPAKESLFKNLAQEALDGFGRRRIHVAFENFIKNYKHDVLFEGVRSKIKKIGSALGKNPGDQIPKSTHSINRRKEKGSRD